MRNTRSDILSPDDEADELAAQAREREKQAEHQRRHEGDLKWLMSDKRGRRIMHAVLADTGLYQLSFTGNSETFFREGRRDVGLKLLATIERLSPDGHIKMLQERNE